MITCHNCFGIIIWPNHTNSMFCVVIVSPFPVVTLSCGKIPQKILSSIRTNSVSMQSPHINMKDTWCIRNCCNYLNKLTSADMVHGCYGSLRSFLDVDWLLCNKFYLNVVCMRCDVRIIGFLLYAFWFPSLQHNCNFNYFNKYLNLHDELLYVIMLDVAMMFMERLHIKYDFVPVMECAVHQLLTLLYF